MFKKPLVPLFLFNSHKGGSVGEERPHFMGGLLLILVLFLHLCLGLWLLKPSNIPPKIPTLKIMEVSLLSSPGPKAEIPPPVPAPPKVEPPKKQAVKKPVTKKTPVKLPEPAKPEFIAQENPPPSSNVAPEATVSAPAPVSRPAPAVVSNEQKTSSGVVPLERIPPKYPPRAANRHIEGWVKIEFTVTTNGTVENAVVVEAQPAEIFDEAALKAINQWTFKEKIVNGVAVEQRAVQTVNFKLPGG